MNRLSLGPLGRRLLLAFVLVAISSVLVLSGAALIGVDRGMQASQQAERAQIASAAAAAAADAYRTAGGWPAADLGRTLAIGDAASATLTVLDANGTTLSTGGMRMGNTDEQGMGMGSGSGSGMSQTVVTASVDVDGSRVGTIRMKFFAMTGTSVRDVAWLWIAVAAIVALIVAIGASWLVTQLLVRPIRSMTDAARSFTNGDRQARATGRAPGELGELADAFNGMADAVVGSDRDRRNLTADVAHELRTPLAALQAGLEELRDGLEEPTPEGLAALHDQSLRLGRIVADLAELSAVERTGLSVHPSTVDLAQVARDALSQREPQLRAAGLDVTAALAGPVFVRADADRLHQAVGNLLANTARYCRPGDTVALTVCSETGKAILRVADSGPGVPPGELPHIFDRLWRGRAAAHVAGSGIGLAVVREIVISHGGTVEAESPPGSGTTITMRLPQSPVTAGDR
ncbi:HAMP domain-containing histidine kinase [Cryobacterium algoritolerans]|uniref:histidine kinase n=1 Tax=Cryobacterium algoritolerans TaxID=1259184 RepID=A0A4R8WJ25_9MICO|nr:HAMP domain-containing sensor histidine kinase [Cryobacterium algoritolerans]TFC10445.1 HAMP domain-containing histidine kinase [Cryobacterium algoritolerans]